MISLGPHREYNDRRRISDGALSANLGEEGLATALAGFLSRLGDVLDPLLAMKSPEAPRVIVAHSRLLREFLFAFRSAQTVPLRGSPLALRWDETNHPDCTALSREDTRISNTGAIGFTLELCSPPECLPAALTMRSCRLDLGARVLPRHGNANVQKDIELVPALLEHLPYDVLLAAGIASILLMIWSCFTEYKAIQDEDKQRAAKSREARRAIASR